VLLDECVPARFGRLLPGHQVMTVPRMGWAGIRNGRLLALAAAAFDVLVTVDGNMPQQQNPATLPVAVLIVHAPSNDIDDLSPLAPAVLAALLTLAPKAFTHVRA
jgi:hypothetical protein